jgi:hypothetical protein
MGVSIQRKMQCTGFGEVFLNKLFFYKNDAGEDREAIFGRAIYRQNQYYL